VPSPPRKKAMSLAELRGKMHRVARTLEAMTSTFNTFSANRGSGPSEFRRSAATAAGLTCAKNRTHLERDRTRNANSWPGTSHSNGFTRAESRPRLSSSRDVRAKNIALI